MWMSAFDSNDWNRNRDTGSISRAVRAELSQTGWQETNTSHQSVVSPCFTPLIRRFGIEIEKQDPFREQFEPNYLKPRGRKPIPHIKVSCPHVSLLIQKVDRLRRQSFERLQAKSMSPLPRVTVHDLWRTTLPKYFLPADHSSLKCSLHGHMREGTKEPWGISRNQTVGHWTESPPIGIRTTGPSKSHV